MCRLLNGVPSVTVLNNRIGSRPAPVLCAVELTGREVASLIGSWPAPLGCRVPLTNQSRLGPVSSKRWPARSRFANLLSSRERVHCGQRTTVRNPCVRHSCSHATNHEPKRTGFRRDSALTDGRSTGSAWRLRLDACPYTSGARAERVGGGEHRAWLKTVCFRQS